MSKSHLSRSKKPPRWFLVSLFVFTALYSLSKFSFWSPSAPRTPSSVSTEIETLQVAPKTDKGDDDEMDSSIQQTSLFDIESLSDSPMASGIRIRLSIETDRKTKQFLYLKVCDNFDGDQMKPNLELKEENYACIFLSYESLLNGSPIIETGTSESLLHFKLTPTKGSSFDPVQGGTLKMTLGRTLHPKPDLRKIDLSLRRESKSGQFRIALYTRSEQVVFFNRLKLHLGASGKYPTGIVKAEFLEQSKPVHKVDYKK